MGSDGAPGRQCTCSGTARRRPGAARDQGSAAPPPPPPPARPPVSRPRSNLRSVPWIRRSMLSRVGDPDQGDAQHRVDEVRGRNRTGGHRPDQEHRREQGGRAEQRPQRHVARDQDHPMNTGGASSTASGWITSIVPTTGADAAAAPEADEHRPTRPRPRPGRTGPRPRAEPVTSRGDQHRHGALQEIAGDDERRPLPAQRPQRVRAARPPGSDRPRIDAAGQPRDQDADRDRPAQVGAHDESEVDQERRPLSLRHRARSRGASERRESTRPGRSHRAAEVVAPAISDDRGPAQLAATPALAAGPARRLRASDRPYHPNR